MNEKRVLEIKHVADLLDMHFHIPCYQRGYRWESKHIEDLLDDLYDFSVQMSETSNNRGKFYCIQPLAVLKWPAAEIKLLTSVFVSRLPILNSAPPLLFTRSTRRLFLM